MPGDIPQLQRAAWLVSHAELAAALRALAERLDPLPTARPELAALVVDLIGIGEWLAECQRYAVAEHRRLGREVSR